jgi:molybdopterin molybdotransferase
MFAAPVGSSVLTFEDARRVIEEQAALIRSNMPASGTESVELLAAAGRVLAEPVAADRDLPPFARSTRDGYAVRSADLIHLPATLEWVAEIKAGETLDRIPANIGSEQTASIMTGAPVPAGADAVVMVEYTSQHGQRVEITRSVVSGENIVPRGAEAREGSLLLDRGLRLNEAGIALAASVGKIRLQVCKRPRVAVLTTGDEIVEVSATPGPTQIRNSNSYSLAAQIQRAGGEPLLLPVAPDEPQGLRRLIEEGLKADLLLMTGGVSMGRYDLVEHALAELQAEFFFTGAKIQPGRPVVFGRGGAGALGRERRATYFFGLPGNPVSTMVTFELFTRPILEALAGQSPRKLVFLHARLKSEIHVKTGLKRFLPAILSGEFEHSEVEIVAWQGSGDIAATARANCYIVFPANRESISAGEWVAVMKSNC